MHRYGYLVAFVTSLFSQGILAQTHPTNLNLNCKITGYPAFGTFYYAPDDMTTLEFYLSSEGTCDSGSYALVTLYSQISSETCGYLPLDGSFHLMQWS